MDSKIPGRKAKHAIVTPVCIQNKGPTAAAAEAIDRLYAEFIECYSGWQGTPANFHFVLTVEAIEQDAPDGR